MDANLEIVVSDRQGGPDGGQAELSAWFDAGSIAESEIQVFITTVVVLILYGFMGGFLLRAIVHKVTGEPSTVRVSGDPAGGGGGGAEFTLEINR